MSESDRTDAMRQLVRKLFKDLGDTATLSTDDIKAAIDQVDDDLETNMNDASFNGNQSIEVNLNANLPQPFKSTATTAQKGLLLAYVAMKKYGAI